ncbi:MAG: hypothetical protein ACK4GN_04475 [Runella sp.]
MALRVGRRKKIKILDKYAHLNEKKGKLLRKKARKNDCLQRSNIDVSVQIFVHIQTIWGFMFDYTRSKLICEKTS